MKKAKLLNRDVTFRHESADTGRLGAGKVRRMKEEGRGEKRGFRDRWSVRREEEKWMVDC
jgi:hypothetical protein